MLQGETQGTERIEEPMNPEFEVGDIVEIISHGNLEQGRMFDIGDHVRVWRVDNEHSQVWVEGLSGKPRCHDFSSSFRFRLAESIADIFKEKPKKLNLPEAKWRLA
jgi:hypothetical protein